MPQDWQALTRLTSGRPLRIERVRLTDADIAIEGPFELPPLAQLSAEDQVFVAAFVRAHGSIKEMEKLFGVSYPTIKNRLNRIGAQPAVGRSRAGARSWTGRPARPARARRDVRRATYWQSSSRARPATGLPNQSEDHHE